MESIQAFIHTHTHIYIYIYNARWSFRASFVNVIKTENSLYLINEDRQDLYLYDFFSLFLGVQSAPEVGPASYEIPCILRKIT